MASRIILDPETLLAQAGEMQNLTVEYCRLRSIYGTGSNYKKRIWERG